jgi:hypothetical protein
LKYDLEAIAANKIAKDAWKGQHPDQILLAMEDITASSLTSGKNREKL